MTTRILRVPGVTFTGAGSPPPIIEPLLVQDDFERASLTGSPAPTGQTWTIGQAGINGTPKISGGALVVESPATASPGSYAYVTIPAPSGNFGADMLISASGQTVVQTDVSQGGLVITTPDGSTGLAWGINRLTMINGTYGTWFTFNSGSWVQASLGSTPSRLTSQALAPAIGKRIGILIDRTAGTIAGTIDGAPINTTIDGTTYNTTTALPAALAAATQLRIGVRTSGNGSLTIDDLKLWLG